MDIQRLCLQDEAAALIPGPLHFSAVQCARLRLVCSLSKVLNLRLPTTTLTIDSPSACADLRTWPLPGSGGAPQLEAAHQFQVDAINTLIGCGPSTTQRWTAYTSKALFPWMLQQLLPNVSVAIQTASFKVTCPAPSVYPSFSGTHPTHHTLQATVDKASLNQHQTSDATSGQPSMHSPLAAVAVSGVAIKCQTFLSTSTDSPEETRYIIRRWGAEAELRSVPPAAAKPAPTLKLSLTANALIVHADQHILCTLQQVCSVLAEYSRFAWYRERRPRVPVHRDVRAWWQHAGHCVLHHLRAVKHDSPAPGRCLPCLPAFVEVFRQQQECSAPGVCHLVFPVVEQPCCNEEA